MTEDNGGTAGRKSLRGRLKLGSVALVSWRDVLATWGTIVLASVAAVFVTLHFIRPAPPLHLTIAGGPEGSNFDTVAGRYRDRVVRAPDGTVRFLERCMMPSLIGDTRDHLTFEYRPSSGS